MKRLILIAAILAALIPITARAADQRFRQDVTMDKSLTIGGNLTVTGTATISGLSLADDSVTTAKILDLNVTTGKLAAEAVTVAKMADLARGSIIVGTTSDRPVALDANDSGKILVGDGTDLASVAVSGDATLANTGALTIGQVLDGSNAANATDNATTPALPVLFTVIVDGGAAESVDVVVAQRVKVVDVWVQHTGGAGDTSDTIQVKSTGNAITAALDWSGADNTVVRQASIDDANSTIAASGTLRVTTIDGDGGDNVGAGIVYVLCVPVAAP